MGAPDPEWTIGFGMSEHRVGLVADVQYADLEDREGARFRSSLDRLSAVLEHFSEEGVQRVIQLGDVIEGHEDIARSEADLDRVLQVFEAGGLPVAHVVGNHCLSIPRIHLCRRLGISTARRSFTLPGWRWLLLDSMELSLQGSEPGMASRWLEDHPLEVHPQASPWNGGLGGAQLDWLEDELRAAAASGESTVVLSHHPVHPGAARARYLAWDHEEVLSRLRSLPEEVVPLAWFSGHDHRGGHVFEAGTGFWTLPGVIAAEGSRGPGIVVELGEGCLELVGFGGAPSYRRP